MRRSKYVDDYSRQENPPELRLSGERARKWRRQVAALSEGDSQETIKTFKFPLELPPDSTVDFEEAARLYDIVEGVGKGSLIGLLCAAHLSGFRLFSSAKEAAIFRNRARYPSQKFAEALKKHFDIKTTPAPKLTPEGIDEFVRISPRRVRGEEVLFNRDSVKEKLYKYWVGKRPDDKADKALLEIAGGMADTLCENFEDWKDVNENPKKALSKIEDYLKSEGEFPALFSSGMQDLSSPIAFDPDSAHIDIMKNGEKQDFLVHRAVAAAASVLRREDPEWDTSKKPKDLQDMFLSPSDNALSWLFGKGWRDYLRDTPAEKIASDYEVPENRIPSVQQLKEFAVAVPCPPFFDMKHYADFRRSIGGKLRSWIANYQKRLKELKTLSEDPPKIANLSEGLKDEKAADLFKGTDVDANSFFKIFATDKFRELGQSASEAIARLEGAGAAPIDEDAKEIEDYSAALSSRVSLINQINNKSGQKVEEAKESNRKDDERFWQSLKITLPEGLKELPKLNRISGGSVNAKQETQDIEKQLNDLISAQSQHFDRIKKWMQQQGHDLNPVSNLIKQEKQKLKQDEKPEKSEELGWRWLLDKIAHESRLLSEANRKKIYDLMLPLFMQGAVKKPSTNNESEKQSARRGKANCNKFFFNHQGNLYRSPRSTSRHGPYDIDLEAAKKEDWLTHVDELIRDTEKKLTKGDNRDNHAVDFRDWLRMRNLYFSLQLKALPEEAGIPANLANLAKLPASISDKLQVPPLLALQMQSDITPKSVFLRAFNLYSSGLNGLCFQALRESFIVRAKFHRIGQDKLLYVPKDKAWKVPDRLSNSDKPISSAVGKAVRDDSDTINPWKTLRRFFEKNFEKPTKEDWDEAVRAYFSQAPHDWFFPVDFGSGVPKYEGVSMTKDGKQLSKKLSERSALRLRGPSSFKNRLDFALLEKMSVNEATLIIDRSYRQRFSWTNGQLSLEIAPENTRLELAMPITDKSHQQDKTELFDRILAIDLGEKRIGYAVFDIKKCLENLKKGKKLHELQPAQDSKGPIAGTVAIRSIRRLMTKVRVHRRRHQPKQKIQQTYSKALEKYRENVIGDVCNRIDTLCYRHGAFPVLEKNLGNLESGGRQLEMIYGSVLRRYTFSEVEAHKAKRAEYWFMKNRWEHPYLTRLEKPSDDPKEGKHGRKDKPLSLFPGVGVDPAGTSQICSKCGRNPVESVRSRSNSIDKLEVKDEGKVELDNGVIQVRKRSLDSEKEKEPKWRHKRPAPKDYPCLTAGSYSIDELVKLVRFHLRRSPRSRQSSDTTQSRYFCPYADCGYEAHADENAALNIGRRFFEIVKLSEKT